MKKAQRLPRKPSALIRVALRDLEKVEKDNRYQVNMGVWHQWLSSACQVCFAGAVMAETLHADPDRTLFPECFDSATRNKLTALNWFRGGVVRNALASLGIQRGRFKNREVANYHHGSGAGFKADMLKLAAYLKAKGL